MKKLSLLVGSVLLLAAILTGYQLFSAGSHPAPDQAHPSGDDQRQVLYWYDPMVPQHRFDKPGKSPFMDMQLVPRYADDPASDGEGMASSGLQIDAAMVQKLGMREAPVQRTALTGSLTLNGRISFNRRALIQLQAPADAFVERVWPLAAGDTVVAGQPLLSLRIPSWLAGQYELLALRAAGESALLASARQRLLSLGMPAAQIAAIEKRGQVSELYQLSAPAAGVLETFSVSAGMTLGRGAPVARLQQLSPLWVEVAVPQTLVQQVQPGAVVSVQIAGIADVLSGKIAQVLPLLDNASGAMVARIEVANPAQRLRPGMTAQVQLQSAGDERQLLVPTEALLRSGKRTLVMRADGNGHFTPLEVLAGAEIGDSTVIEAGLQDGERVVVSGQFLLDSEASLRGIDVVPLSQQVSADHSLHYAEATVTGYRQTMITLDHGPFESLSMPAMEMRFILASPALLDTITLGQRVRVGVRETADGLRVESLQPLDAATDGAQQ